MEDEDEDVEEGADDEKVEAYDDFTNSVYDLLFT